MVFLVFIRGRCISGERSWGGKGLESEKGVLEEKELLGVNIIEVFLAEELTITVDFIIHIIFHMCMHPPFGVSS